MLLQTELKLFGLTCCGVQGARCFPRAVASRCAEPRSKLPKSKGACRKVAEGFPGLILLQCLPKWHAATLAVMVIKKPAMVRKMN